MCGNPTYQYLFLLAPRYLQCSYRSWKGNWWHFFLHSSWLYCMILHSQKVHTTLNWCSNGTVHQESYIYTSKSYNLLLISPSKGVCVHYRNYRKIVRKRRVLHAAIRTWQLWQASIQTWQLWQASTWTWQPWHLKLLSLINWLNLQCPFGGD